uniref:proline-rich protein HaeIII subfamily 1-like n=1 Tax=Macaca mulatta TaxID=9544 RepID=UPI0007327118|nr:proline-rich protein HaeIII subfamily 1-like [Macaca mulatta]XP_015309914.1 proline-rich protein HaeIII subfamily 1-like [Macaca fascicularis]
MGGGTVIASRAGRDPRGWLCANFRHRYPPAASPTPPGAGAPRSCSGPDPPRYCSGDPDRRSRGWGTPRLRPHRGDPETSDPTRGPRGFRPPQADPEISDPRRRISRAQVPSGGVNETSDP